MDGPDVYRGMSLDDVLEHHGIKGMKWGVRRKNPRPTTSVGSRNGKVTNVKLSDGRKSSNPSEDASRTAILKKQAGKRSTDSLSNKELQDLVTRMNLEQQYKRLAPPSKKSAALKFVGDILLNVGKQQATKLATDFASKQLEELLKKAAKSAVKEAVS